MLVIYILFKFVSLLIGDNYNAEPNRYYLNCFMLLKKDNYESIIIEIITEDILPIFSLIINTFVIVKISYFYFSYSLDDYEKKNMSILLLYPIVYFISTIPLIIYSYYDI